MRWSTEKQVEKELATNKRHHENDTGGEGEDLAQVVEERNAELKEQRRQQPKWYWREVSQCWGERKGEYGPTWRMEGKK